MRTHFALALLAVLSSSQAHAQEAFKVSFATESVRPARWRAAWSQVASGIESAHPFQTQPVLAASYQWDPYWSAGLSYDFQSLAFEVVRRFSDDETNSRWKWGVSFGLVPELRSFSWKGGPWITYAFTHARLSLLVQIASLNAWGYGLWAADLEGQSSGRSWVLPAQLSYAHEIADGFEARTALEAQTGFANAQLRNHVSLLIGFAKGWP